MRGEESAKEGYHFCLLEERMAFLFCVAFSAVKPFSTLNSVRKAIILEREQKDVQHGDLIETCALRMCLLEGEFSSAPRIEGENLPHDDL